MMILSGARTARGDNPDDRVNPGTGGSPSPGPKRAQAAVFRFVLHDATYLSAPWCGNRRFSRVHRS